VDGGWWLVVGGGWWVVVQVLGLKNCNIGPVSVSLYRRTFRGHLSNGLNWRVADSLRPGPGMKEEQSFR